MALKLHLIFCLIYVTVKPLEELCIDIMLKELASGTFYIVYLLTKHRKHISFLQKVAIPPLNCEAKIIFPDLQLRAVVMRTMQRDVKGGFVKR